MPRCDCVLRVSILAVASLLEVRAWYASGVSGHLYRFSRSRRVLLYKLIGGNDRRLSHVSLADWIPTSSIGMGSRRNRLAAMRDERRARFYCAFAGPLL
jgi:hypothetical protein